MAKRSGYRVIPEENFQNECKSAAQSLVDQPKGFSELWKSFLLATPSIHCAVAIGLVGGITLPQDRSDSRAIGLRRYPC